MSTYIGAKKKNGSIKVVEYLGDGELETLGVLLHEFFKDIIDVKTILKTTVDFIEDDEVFHAVLEEGEKNVFEEFEDIDDLVENMDSNDFYYIFTNVWNVVGETFPALTELETALEELN